MQMQGACRQCGLTTLVSSNSHLCEACANKNMIDQTDSAHAKIGPGYERLLAGQEKARLRRNSAKQNSS